MASTGSRGWFKVKVPRSSLNTSTKPCLLLQALFTCLAGHTDGSFPLLCVHSSPEPLLFVSDHWCRAVNVAVNSATILYTSTRKYLFSPIRRTYKAMPGNSRKPFLGLLHANSPSSNIKQKAPAQTAATCLHSSVLQLLSLSNISTYTSGMVLSTNQLPQLGPAIMQGLLSFSPHLRPE